MSCLAEHVKEKFHDSGNSMMFSVPPALRKQFAACLHEQTIPQRVQVAYQKWLRYYWDFCHKYHFPHERKESLPHFLKKLQEKRQTQAQQEQAVHAIGLYYDLLEAKTSLPTSDPRFDKLRTGSQTDSGLTEKNTPLSPSLRWNSGQARGESILVPPGSAILFAGGTPALPGQPTPGPSQADSGLTGNTGKMPALPGQSTLDSLQGGSSGAGFNDDKKHPPGPPQGGNLSASRPTRNGQGSSWQAEYTRLAETLQGRQYAPKIAKAYTRWLRKFQAFTRSKARLICNVFAELILTDRNVCVYNLRDGEKS